ncbi:histidine phosphatase family protein [Phocaeicola sp.]
MIDLYLARHGQTEENIARIFQGHLPGTLTAEGIAQAEALRDSLCDTPLDAVVSSDLKRCMDTARIVIADRNLPWTTTPLLREIDWGSWTGLYIKEVDLQHVPADVETEEMLYHRAGRFLDDLKLHYNGKRVLAVGHGLINRAIQAHIEEVSLEHLRSVPRMNNAELRHFIVKS